MKTNSLNQSILGFISSEELAHFDSLVTPNTKYYLPMQWALTLLGHAREMGFVKSDLAMVDVTQKVKLFLYIKKI